jgi:predicted ArsR family transcriptional regulator
MGMNGIDGTREQILALLRRRERMGVDDLARELKLAGATVRRHLDLLLRDKFVSVAPERGGTGRPRHIFAITDSGSELFRQHYVRMTRRLLNEIVSLSADETAGRSGAQLADLIFARMAERLATEYRARVEGDTLAERVRSVAHLLSEEGLDFEVAEDPTGLSLLGRGCPCTRLLGEHDGACDHDRVLLSRILGVEVTPLGAESLPGDFVCGYLVPTSAPRSPLEAAPAAV